MKTRTIKGWVPGDETEAATLKMLGCATCDLDVDQMVFDTKKMCLASHGPKCQPKKSTITVTVEHL